MKRFLSYIFLCWSFAFLFSACSPKDSLPSQVLSVEEMSDILLDFQLAESYNPSYYGPTNQHSIYPENRQERLQVFYQQILQIHEVDTATFFRSYRYYSHHPDWIKKVYKTMQDTIQVRLTSIQKKLQKKRERAKRQIPEFMSFWKKDLNTLHSFYDSTTNESSNIIYPWELSKMTLHPRLSSPKTFWNQYFKEVDSLYEIIEKNRTIPAAPF